jgi:predicted DNA-binding transcriptional regulator AlpA
MEAQHIMRGERFLRAGQVAARLGCSQSHFYRMLRRKEFPPGTDLIPSRWRIWPESVVEEWMAQAYAKAAE